MLEAVESALAEATQLRAEHAARIADLVNAVEERGDTDFTDDESAAFAEARAAIAELDGRIGQLEERAEGLRAARRAAEAAPAPARVVSEPKPYEHRSRDVSFVADLVAVATGRATPEAQDRISRHQRADQMERRAIGTGALAGLTIPQYLTDLVAPLARAGRPFADICRSHQLPESGMTVEISRITTGTSVAAQASENTSVSETDLDDTQLSVPVRTIAGRQTISVQALTRSEGAEDVVVADLAAAYAAELDRQLINGDGTGGTHVGVRNVTGVVSVTYTDATPTAPELWPRLLDLVQQVQSGSFTGVSHFVMHPRRFWWIAANVGTSFPFLNMAATNQAGSVGGTAYGQGPSGVIAGIPVIVDGNIPTNLGAGTNEDVILGVTASECHLWEDSGPLRMEVDVASSLGVTISLFGFSAFTAGRYPAANGRITGTGLVTPAFV